MMLRYLLLLILTGLSLMATASEAVLQARQGMLDLKLWRVDLDPVIELKGDWLVYPGQLLTLEDLSLQPIPSSRPFPLAPIDCQVSTLDRAVSSHRGVVREANPNASYEQGMFEGRKPLVRDPLSPEADSNSTDTSPLSRCIATYVLELRNLPTQPLAIMIPELSTAFHLSWNDVPLIQGGRVSDQLRTFEPYVGYRITNLQTATGRGVLILQVANLSGAQGPVRHLLLGEASALKAHFAQGELLQALSAAIAGIGCLLLLLQQKARRRYEKGLWGLALFSFATLVYTTTEGYTVLSWFVDQPLWADVLRLNIASQHLFLPGLIFWLAGSYQGAFPNWYLILIRLQLLLFVPVVLLLPEPVLIVLESPQMLLNLALGIIGFGYMVSYRRWLQWSCKEKVANVSLLENSDKQVLCRQMNALLATLLFVLIPAIHDVLVYQQLLMGMYWLPMGFVCFIVAQIFLLAVQRARQHAYLDSLNQEISANQQQLREEVELRTRELKEKIEQLDEATSELRYFERHDGLTGLLRQSSFLAESRQCFSETDASLQSVSLILLDLDRYKQISAQYGPVAADQGMKEIASLLSRWSEEGGLCARLEGESFALLIPGMEEQEALQEAEWLRLRISQRSVMIDEMADNGHEFHVTASFGVCTYLMAEAEIRTMMDAAEIALNRAKANGRNCVVGYSQLPLDPAIARSG